MILDAVEHINDCAIENLEYSCESSINVDMAWKEQEIVGLNDKKNLI